MIATEQLDEDLLATDDGGQLTTPGYILQPNLGHPVAVDAEPQQSMRGRGAMRQMLVHGAQSTERMCRCRDVGGHTRPVGLGMPTIRSEARLQSSLGDVRRLLDRHRILDTIAARQEGPKRDLLEDLQHRQNAAELESLLRSMHAADMAYVLGGLPLPDRQRVWEPLSDEQAGAVFVEVSEAVRDSLVQLTPSDHLVRLLTTLDADDLAFVSDAVPPDLLARASAALEGVERSVFEDSIQYQDQSVGAFMTREWVAVLDSSTVESTLAELRRLGALPPQTDRLFVVDARHVLVGTVPLEAILVQPPATPHERPVDRYAGIRSLRRSRGRRDGVRALRPGVGAGG